MVLLFLSITTGKSTLEHAHIGDMGTLDQAPLGQLSKVQAQKSTLEQAHLILEQTHYVPDPAHFLWMIQRVDDPVCG